MVDIKNSDDLRNFLVNELKRVAQGETTPAMANAAANLAGKINGSIKLELEYNKMVGTAPNISFIKNLKKDEPQKLEDKTK